MGVDWAEHMVRPVRFADGVTALATAGATCLLEIGPDATLCKMLRGCLQSWREGVRPVALSVVDPGDRPTPTALLASFTAMLRRVRRAQAGSVLYTESVFTQRHTPSLQATRIDANTHSNTRRASTATANDVSVDAVMAELVAVVSHYADPSVLPPTSVEGSGADVYGDLLVLDVLDSLSLVEMCSRLSLTYALEPRLSPTDVFQQPRVRDLCVYIAQRCNQGSCEHGAKIRLVAVCFKRCWQDTPVRCGDKDSIAA